MFRRAVGVTPYQFLLNLRLRRAALGLLSSRDPVSAIAFDSGFGDLSTFNAAFRDRFGSPPPGFPAKQRAQLTGGASIAIAMQISHGTAGQVAHAPCRRVKNR